jgi:C-terminal of Roc, COR, domain/Ras of Complex, Roc, domain of DAPkinase
MAAAASASSDLEAKTPAQIAVEELLDEETWIKAGNEREARVTRRDPTKGDFGSAVERVRKAIAAEPGGDVGPNGLTTELNLWTTGIRALPPQLFTQTKLEKLSLSSNEKISGAFPPEIGALTELKVLDLSATAVSSLPLEAAMLTKLQRLYWWISKAPGATVRIPATVFAAFPLDCIMWFEETRVEIMGVPGEPDLVLPTSLTQNDNLKNNDVKEFIAACHRSHGTTQLPFRLRTMFVGTADAGKTTLMEWLTQRRGRFGTFKRAARGKVNHRAVTFGVDVATWETDWPVGGEDKSESNIVVTLYDFAGQPEYHPTHELFLASDVLFVMVLNLRTALLGDFSNIYAEAAHIEEWMRLIASRAPGARVLVVGTHADSSKVNCSAILSGFAAAMEVEMSSNAEPGTEMTFQSADSIAKSPSERLGRVLARTLALTARQTGLRVHTKSLFVVDALHGKASASGAFQRAFRDQATEIVGERDAVPSSIFEMAETVSRLARKSPVLSLSDFKNHIQDAHEWYSPIVPPILRSAGVIEYFADVPGLEDDVFLSPEWLAKMLAAIVDERRGHGASVDGIVKAATLHRLWRSSDEVENAAMRASLIRVMRAFGLLHPVDTTGERFVMTSLLSKFSEVSSRPAVASLISRLAAAPRILRRVYSFSVFPSGLLPRVFSQLHGVQDGNLLGWLTGLVFEMPVAGSGASVSSTTGLLRADVSGGCELDVRATHDQLFSVFEKALLVVREVMFAGLQVFRDGTSISVFATSPDSGATSTDFASSAAEGAESFGDVAGSSAWSSDGASVSDRRLVVDLGVLVWDPRQFGVRTASPSAIEILGVTRNSAGQRFMRNGREAHFVAKQPCAQSWGSICTEASECAWQRGRAGQFPEGVSDIPLFRHDQPPSGCIDGF